MGVTDRRRKGRVRGPRALTPSIGLLLLAVTACGGSGETSTEASNSTTNVQTNTTVNSPTSVQTNTTVDTPTTQDAETTEVPTDTTAPPTTPSTRAPEQAPVEPRLVASVLDEVPEAGGWYVPAGTWRSTAFEPDVRFDLGADYLLVNQSPDAIELAPVGGDRSHRLSILVPNAVGGDAGIAVAVPDDAVDYLAGLAEGGYIDLDRAERIDGPDGTTGFVGDFRTYALATRGLGPLTTYACPLGPDCVYIMHTEAGTDIQVVEGEPIRIVGRTIDERPYRVVARGKAGPAFEALAADALAIADSLELLDDDEATPSPQLLATVGSRTDRIPPGEYVARLGDEAVVGFSVTDEVGPIALDFGGEERVTLDVDGVATVSLLAPHWIDPAAAQTADDPSEADLLGRRVETTADYDAWSSGFRDSEELGRLTVSGRDAVRFGGPLRDDAPTWPCADRPGLVGTRCMWLYLVDDAWWYGNDVPVTDGGGYHIDGTGLLLVIDADEQSTDVATEIQPLLDAITIRPLDPTGPGNE